MVKEALTSATGRRPHASDSDTLQGEGGRYEVSRKAAPRMTPVPALSALEPPRPSLGSQL